jgi:hypothetical protein
VIVTLTNGATTYEIANGTTRLYQTLGSESFALQQQTQTETRARASWITGFHSRAARSLQLRYTVTFPQCSSLAAAVLESRQVPVLCPKGGVLVEQEGSTSNTFSDAWIEGGISVDRVGVRNTFTFNFTAIDPSFAALSPLAQMDARYVANLSAITGLTGGGDTKLDGLTTTDVTVGFTAFLPALLISSVAVAKMFQLVTGTDAENADPTAGTLIIRPDDYHASTNAKVWKEKL